MAALTGKSSKVDWGQCELPSELGPQLLARQRDCAERQVQPGRTPHLCGLHSDSRSDGAGTSAQVPLYHTLHQMTGK